MSGWSEDPRQSTNPGERPGDGAPAAVTPGARWAFRLSLLVLALVAGLAVASPFQQRPAAETACAQQAPDLQVIVLPPGHPPIPGLAPASPTGLPPGHPPIDAEALGRRARPIPAGQPFQPPATVEL